ncbi:MAG: flagellar basal-body rod protein FlgF [Deltaproteobacteria bacterium]|nr:flagellar basal-body rod protein FlgF [Deltaproteobacteria bacterium]
MIYGLASMGKECIKQMHLLDTATHNVANVNTPGFKAEKVFFLEGSSAGGGSETAIVKEPLLRIDYSPAHVQKTGNVFDVALGGDGFFVVETKTGNGYTRNGRFSLNSEGTLVTQNGDYVLGTSGRITISGNDVQIDEKGAIRVDGGTVGSLKVVEFEKPEMLSNAGKGLLLDPNDTAGLKDKEDPAIHSGCLELSNVQAIREMVNMIRIHRSFEAYQKTMQTLQDQEKLSTTRIGRVG